MVSKFDLDSTGYEYIPEAAVMEQSNKSSGSIKYEQFAYISNCKLLHK
jgi:hypothetical protein